jgi:hypothetical protein
MDQLCLGFAWESPGLWVDLPSMFALLCFLLFAMGGDGGRDGDGFRRCTFPQGRQIASPQLTGR